MLINSSSLQALRTGFSTAFQAGLDIASSQWTEVATKFTSTTKNNTYGWLGDVPGMRKWVGPRQVRNLKQYSYQIENEPYEETIGVDRDDIADDNLGIYTPRFTAMGRAVASSFDMMVFAALVAGFTNECYDGQNFFDTDHPVLDKDGKTTLVSNTGGGVGAPWFLMDSKQPINPIILQVRKEAQFVSKDQETDDNVFMNKEFVYGADGRWATGYGFWQWCFGSKQTLDAASYAAARASLGETKGDYGRPIGIIPDLLVVSPALESAGRKLLNSENATGGETNEWKGTAKLLVAPWLA